MSNISRQTSKIISGGGSGGPLPPEDVPKPQAKPKDELAAYVAARDALGQRAVGAGASRTGSDADLLGFTEISAKRRGRARTLVG